jgi:hypothetical protein
VRSSTVFGWMRNNRVRIHYNLDEVRMKTSKSGCLGSIVLGDEFLCLFFSEGENWSFCDTIFWITVRFGSFGTKTFFG